MLIEQHLVQAAILDVNLSDRDVTPIAELLIGSGVPVIFYSAVALRERYPSAWFCKKPTLPVRLLNKLVASMGVILGRYRSPSRSFIAGRLTPYVRTFGRPGGGDPVLFERLSCWWQACPAHDAGRA